MVQSWRGGYEDGRHAVRTFIRVMGFWKAMLKRLFGLKEVAITKLIIGLLTSKFISVKGRVSVIGVLTRLVKNSKILKTFA